MGKIKITSGSASDGEVNYHHLVSNHLLDPSKNIDKVIMYAEQRYLMTLLVSGATMSGQTVRGYTPSGGDSIKTYIPQVPQGELISGKAWSYHIMGRIQKATEIIGTAAVGAVVAATSSRGGSFKLYLKDNYIGMGMVATFPNMKQARVSTLPQGSEGKWLYSFDTFAGDTFSWDSWVNVMAGTKTVFGGWSAYGERSRRGLETFIILIVMFSIRLFREKLLTSPEMLMLKELFGMNTMVKKVLLMRQKYRLVSSSYSKMNSNHGGQNPT